MRPLVLCILDGWGVRQDAPDNAITCADTPTWDNLQESYPNTTLQASGQAVGLPDGQMGNSEVGHMTIGTGRVVLQDLPLIDAAINENRITKLATFNNFIDTCRQNAGVVHLMGLLSPGGVHSHENHIFYLAKELDKMGLHVILHAILDGRDTPPKSAITSLKRLEDLVPSNIRLGTIIGRFYAMDRDKRWDRTKLAYEAIVNADAVEFPDVTAAIQDAYAHGETDEFVKPRCMKGYAGISEGDALFMTNFRSDRVRQILSSIVQDDFSEFTRSSSPKLSIAMGMTPYSEDLSEQLLTLFPKQQLNNSMGEVIANLGLKQFRIAETEKYAHVTFFLNGGREDAFIGEDRKLINSPKVATYDIQPEMSSVAVTDELISAIDSRLYSLLIVNFANTDMVGHTGNFAATVEAVEAVDICLGRILMACEINDHTILITADHGNAEQTFDDCENVVLTAHTTNPVPFIVANSKKELQLDKGGLADIAPTILELLEIEQAEEMTGKSLIV